MVETKEERFSKVPEGRHNISCKLSAAKSRRAGLQAKNGEQGDNDQWPAYSSLILTAVLIHLKKKI
jgi:hypothetical protein